MVRRAWRAFVWKKESKKEEIKTSAVEWLVNVNSMLVRNIRSRNSLCNVNDNERL